MEIWEAAEEAAAARELLDKQVQVKDGCIVLNATPDNTLANYNIELNRCDTPAKLLGWIQHLTEKSWLTMGMLDRFVSRASHENGIEVQRDA